MRDLFVFALLAAFALFGCSENSDVPSGPVTSPAVTVSPADGSSDVRLDAAIELRFSDPVDRELVERAFHVISESALMDSTCTDPTMDHTPMMDCMDGEMMSHMELYHSTQGQYTWNEAGTACTFQPVSLMAPSTRYMMHMDREMTEEIGLHECCVDMMQGHGSGMMDGEMTMHFTTMAAGGHDGHH